MEPHDVTTCLLASAARAGLHGVQRDAGPVFVENHAA
jgi:hypothetical protein